MSQELKKPANILLSVVKIFEKYAGRRFSKIRLGFVQSRNPEHRVSPMIMGAHQCPDTAKLFDFGGWGNYVGYLKSQEEIDKQQSLSIWNFPHS